MMRVDKRKDDELRKVTFEKGYLSQALGSCLVKMGNTHVLCTATVDEKIPPFMRGSGKGWLTAEYGMLPASCGHRIQREANKGKISGRTSEIQRLIGRSLRSVTDLTLLGERTIWIDADVIQGDGGTRTASITGGFIALTEAIEKLMAEKILAVNPLKDFLAAVSVGMHDGRSITDLCYLEDSSAQVDMNVVMTGAGEFVEIQGTAEGRTFSQKDMNAMLALAKRSIRKLVARQRKLTTLSFA